MRYSSRMGNSGTAREQQGMDGGKQGGVRVGKEQPFRVMYENFIRKLAAL